MHTLPNLPPRLHIHPAPPAPSPPSPTHPVSLLQSIHDRYMRVPSVACWLTAREALTDFHVARAATAALVSTQPAAAPQLLSPSLIDLPFPSSDDLSFSDSTTDGFALGHVWGDTQCDTHPFAPLAMRMHNHRWHKVCSRKFAADLSTEAALETVEYTWFADDSAVVSITHAPFSPAPCQTRISLHLFYTPHNPPQSVLPVPTFALLTQDHTVCTICGTDICSCPDAVAPPHSNHSSCFIMPSSREHPTQSDSHYYVQSWQHRYRLVTRGSKRGVMTIIFNPFADEMHPDVSMRQEFYSIFHDSASIATRINEHVTRLLIKLPNLHNSAVATPTTPSVDASVTPRQDSYDLQVHHKPISATATDPSWFPLARRADMASLSKPQSPDPEGADAVYRSRDVLLPMAAHRLQGETGDASTSTGLTACGREKGSDNCKCAPGHVPDASLAHILNSQGSVLDAGILPRVITPPAEHCAPSETRGSMIGDLDDEKERAGVGLSLDSTVGNCCLPSMALPLSNQPMHMAGGESALKRARTDASTIKTEPVAYGCPGDGKDKEVGLPQWNVNAVGDRPLSTLGRAFGVARSPSPLTLNGGLHKTPSPPPRLMLNGSGSGGAVSAKTSSCNGVDYTSGMSGGLEALAPLRGGEGVSADPEGPRGGGGSGGTGGVKRRADRISSSNMRPGKQPGDASSTAASTSNSGVCCELCGITFAKRGNKMRHILTVHNRLKQFECDLCGAKFGLKADLGRHRYRIHESRAYVCETCGKSFAEEGQLELHVRVSHEEDARPWECKMCHIRFGRKSSLTRHEQTVHQHTRFVCRVCKKSYSQRFDAIRHERKVHNLNDKAGGVVLRH